VTGSAVDYFYEVLGIKYSYTIELRPSEGDNTAFVLSPDQIEPTGREMWAFHARVAETLLAEYA